MTPEAIAPLLRTAIKKQKRVNLVDNILFVDGCDVEATIIDDLTSIKRPRA